MSRLIFEGDTTERFGKLFPKPYISEIRIFDNAIEADVMLFAEVPLDDDEAEAFIDEINEGHGELVLVGAFLDQDEFDRSIDPNSEDEFYKNSFFTLHTSPADFSINSPFQNVEYTYNSEGRRFAEGMVTFTITNERLAREGESEYLSMEKDRYFATFTCYTTPNLELNTSVSGMLAQLLTAPENKYSLLRNQTSDLSYEKILNADGTVNTEDQVVFKLPSGNYYDGIPLQSLDKTFKQTNNVSHQSIVDLINPILSPYIGTIPEADNLSLTLSQFAKNPDLLTQIEKNIKAFSNKSSATTTGQLYNQLVNAVNDIDNLLQFEINLDKRIESTTKVKDRRGTLSIQDSTISSKEATSAPLGDIDAHRSELYGSWFIYTPLISRTLYPRYRAAEMNYDNERNFAVLNSCYLFYDHGKAINYQSKISKIFNPYNILILMGARCLNEYFKLTSVLVNKFTSGTEPHGKAVVIEAHDYGDNGLSYEYTYFTNDPDENYALISDYTSARSFARAGNVKLYSHITDRAFNFFDLNKVANSGMQNYKLRCFEIYDLENLQQSLSKNIRYRYDITIEDTTMYFYDQFIRRQILELNETLKNYFNFANQFCSYNNIDERFNDFFASSILNEFNEPYPWIQAPILYTSMVALINNSYNRSETGLPIISTENRKRQGGLLSLDGLKNSAKQLSLQISPETGNLTDLEDFVTSFQELANLFVKSGPFDEAFNIYDASDEGYILNTPIDEVVFVRRHSLTEPITNSYVLETFVGEKEVFAEDSPDKEDFLTLSEVYQKFKTIAGRLPSNGLETSLSTFIKLYIEEDLDTGQASDLLNYPFFYEAGWSILFNSSVIGERDDLRYDAPVPPNVLASNLRLAVKDALRILIPTIIKIREVTGSQLTLGELLEKLGAGTFIVQGYDSQGNPV